jgi:hypothetical protein
MRSMPAVVPHQRRMAAAAELLCLPCMAGGTAHHTRARPCTPADAYGSTRVPPDALEVTQQLWAGGFISQREALLSVAEHAPPGAFVAAVRHAATRIKDVRLAALLPVRGSAPCARDRQLSLARWEA